MWVCNCKVGVVFIFYGKDYYVWVCDFEVFFYFLEFFEFLDEFFVEVVVVCVVLEFEVEDYGVFFVFFDECFDGFFF